MNPEPQKHNEVFNSSYFITILLLTSWDQNNTWRKKVTCQVIKLLLKEFPLDSAYMCYFSDTSLYYSLVLQFPHVMWKSNFENLA